ncbi:hypothetical protein CCC_00184 [Paramagnetospirillum magnetotacticum MS-1]|uniref:Uncharacterized protein n=1 Tax=Paramagnetospirillum magnetotacticum MS-1 TaxID=272627 RepID=A0A0C2YPU9_PARME|nr:hypothetical protein CCC_00184 [Paramagnetospirillum magnetotacticum MS-1]
MVRKYIGLWSERKGWAVHPPERWTTRQRGNRRVWLHSGCTVKLRGS